MALSDNTTKIDSLLTAINNLPSAGGGGTPLPSLTDPASASDILYGKEAIDGQGQVLTGTLVPPVDTGANGLYKSLIQNGAPDRELIDSGLTRIRPFAFYGMTSLVKVSLPNVTYLGEGAFDYCSKLTGIINVPSASNNSSYSLFADALERTVVIKIGVINRLFHHSTQIRHAWLPNQVTLLGDYIFSTGGINLRTVQIDNCDSISLNNSTNGRPGYALILRKQDTITALSSIGNGTLTGYIYVPRTLLQDYKTATNWTTYSSKIYGIDQDTTCNVGDTFVPTTTATGIARWGILSLQSYTTYSAFDITTGSVATTHDGRLLIRAFDANDNILHVTVLQIGTGFDEEQNLLENI